MGIVEFVRKNDSISDWGFAISDLFFRDLLFTKRRMVGLYERQNTDLTDCAE